MTFFLIVRVKVDVAGRHPQFIGAVYAAEEKRFTKIDRVSNWHSEP
jgi:hypothetical protein